MKPIIMISFLLIGFSARSQSPQATCLFNFDFERELITIDTVIRFEGLSKKQIIDLSSDGLIDALKKPSYAREMERDDRLVGASSFELYASFSMDRWIDFRITILAKDDSARMIIENIESYRLQKKGKGAYGRQSSTITSAIELYYFRGKHLTSKRMLQLQNRVESNFIEVIDSWKKSINELRVPYDDW